MLRTALHVLLPLLLPLLVYLLAALVFGERSLPEWWRRAPWPWLIASGFVLAAISLAVWALTGGSNPGGLYVPPHFEGGRVVPGQNL